MHKTIRNHILTIACACTTAALSAQAMTWNSENQADADTLLHYTFNGTGTNITDNGPNGYDNNISNLATRAGAPADWLNVPAGDYLAQRNPADALNMSAKVNITNIDYNKGLTISLWYRALDGAGVTNAGELFRFEGPGILPRVSLVTDNFGATGLGRLRLTANITGTNLVEFGTNSIWRHCAVVYDPLDGDASNGGEWQFYLDGVSSTTIIHTNDLTAVTSAEFKAGDNIFNNAPLRNGDLDEVFIHNGIITDFTDGYAGTPGNDDDADGIPNDWETLYFGCSTCATGTDDPDLDGSITFDEYVFDTNPTSTASFYNNQMVTMTGAGVVSLTAGPPTSTGRIYDVYVSDELQDGSQAWNPVGLDVAGLGAGTPVVLTVTNEGAGRFYRTGVTVP